MQAERGVYLKASPRPDAAKQSPLIAFNARVYVQRHTPQADVAQRWADVAALDAGCAGFIEERFLASGPPEPTATLRPVAHHDTLGKIARDVYGEQLAAGGDARLYVQALYEANRGLPGISLGKVDLGWSRRLPREQAEAETLNIYLGGRVLQGQTLWIRQGRYVRRP